MKLLFDNNLSLRLLARLQDVFTDSQHVAYLGLDAVDDAVVWQYALEHDCCIVTKDADFNDLSVVRGSPPKVLWLIAFVSCIELFMHAFTYQLYQILGIFIPLIVTNCALLGRAEAFASKNNTAAAAFDGLMIGVGFTLVLVLLGAMRELLGNTLYLPMHLLFGDMAKDWTLTIPDYKKFLFFIYVVIASGLSRSQ